MNVEMRGLFIPATCTAAAVVAETVRHHNQEPGVAIHVGLHPNSTTPYTTRNTRNTTEAIAQAESAILTMKHKYDVPGVSVAVSVNGTMVWKQGYGYADVENQTPCWPDSVMKIASVSKPITMAMLASVEERGLIQWTDPVSKHVPYWPQKLWDGQKVDIRVLDLASHFSGLRDYKKITSKKRIKSDDEEEFGFEEFYIKRRFKNIEASVSLFKDDPLISKPGSEFHYTNHGFTLLAACMEGATKKTYPKQAREFFHQLGMDNTHLDKKNKLIYNRAKHYTKSSRTGEVLNAPFTESSFKWAGAGIISTATDLIRFGNAILYSYQNYDGGILKPTTVRKLWAPRDNTMVSWHKHGRYGMGWQIISLDGKHLEGKDLEGRDLERQHLDKKPLEGNHLEGKHLEGKHLEGQHLEGRDLDVTHLHEKYLEGKPLEDDGTDGNSFIAGHRGTTVGASSVLIILPTSHTVHASSAHGVAKPHGTRDDTHREETPSSTFRGSESYVERDDAHRQTILSSMPDCEVSKPPNSTDDTQIQRTPSNSDNNVSKAPTIEGVVVAILCNMQGVSVGPVAIDVACILKETIA